MGVASADRWIIQNILKKWNVGCGAIHPEFSQRPPCLGDGLCKISRRGMADHLGQQTVKGGAGAISGVSETVHAHARPTRRFKGGDLAAAGFHRAIRQDRFHVHPRLNGVALCLGGGEVQAGHRLTPCQAELQLDEIDAHYLFRHRMFNLKTRVRLYEDKGLIAHAAGVDQKL